MPSFDFSGISKKSSSQDYGFLVDSLEIMENRLASDGKLSPGDQKLLKQKAQQIYANPGLSNAQRSNIEVKISRYDRDAATTNLKDTSDLNRINRDIQNETKNVVSAVGNDPISVLTGKQALLEMKLFRLKEIAANEERAGDDSSATQLELSKTQNEWLDTNAALEFTKTYQPGSAPSTDFVLDIETNSKGEIRDVQVSRSGDSKPGYLATSGVLSGFSIRGKVNSKISSQEGKNVFKLGNQTFSASSLLRPGADGTFKADTLVADSQQSALGSRGLTRGSSEFLDLNPSDLRIQRSSNPGEYIQTKDSIYKDLGNGKYERYVGATKEQLGIDDSDILSNLPDMILKTVRDNTVKTTDTTPAYTPPEGVMYGPPKPSSLPAAPEAAAPGPAAVEATGRSRTPSPTVRSPKSAPGIAEGLYQGAKSFLGGLFGNTQ